MDYSVSTEPVCEPVTVAQVKINSRITHSLEDDYIASLITAARLWCESYLSRALVVRTVTAKLDTFTDEIELPMTPLVAVDSITYVDSAGVTQTLSSSVYDVDTVSAPGKIIPAYNQSWPSVRGHHHDITITYKCGYAAKFTTAITTSAKKLTVYGRDYTNGDKVRLINSANDLPSPLEANTDYCVVNQATGSVEMAASAGGTAITLTDDGTGVNFIGIIPQDFCHAIMMLAGDLYKNREDTTSMQTIEVPNGVKRLLFPHRLGLIG